MPSRRMFLAGILSGLIPKGEQYEIDRLKHEVDELKHLFELEQQQTQAKFRMIADLLSLLITTADGNTKLFDERIKKLESSVFPSGKTKKKIQV